MVFATYSSRKIIYTKSNPHDHSHEPMMHKWYRTGALMASFVVLFLINAFLLYSYMDYHHQKVTQKVLFEELQLANEGNSDRVTNPSMVLGAFDPSVEIVDGRAANLKRILRHYNSPLYDSAEFMVAEADKYQFHYGLLFAISMQESQGCKVIPPGSHNCWGYGIYGDKVTTFESYEEAIATVSKGLYKNYIQKGLTTPEEIMSKYTPSSNGSWSNAVRFFFAKLDE